MTPPFGYNLFLMRAMAPKEVTIFDIYRSIIPFVLVMLIGLTLVMAFPQIALWLPQLYRLQGSSSTLSNCPPGPASAPYLYWGRSEARRAGKGWVSTCRTRS